MKKFLATLMILTAVLGMVACTSNKSQKDTTRITGVTDGNVYENLFIGLGFNLPSGWEFASDEEIRELNNISSDMMDDKYAEQIKKADIVYDMLATQLSTGSSVSINLEKVSALGAIATDAQYVESAVASVKTVLESMGATNISAEQTKVKIAGENLYALDVSCKVNGVAIYEKVICKKVDNYFVCITVATAGTDTTANVISQFFPVVVR